LGEVKGRKTTDDGTSKDIVEGVSARALVVEGFSQGKHGPQATSSNSEAEEFQWSKIWKIPCVPKVGAAD
jgi:hypothetical protein